MWRGSQSQYSSCGDITDRLQSLSVLDERARDDGHPPFGESYNVPYQFGVESTCSNDVILSGHPMGLH